MDLTDYQDRIRPTLQTGDTLAFSSGGLTGWIIQKRTHSRYTHVGLILRITWEGVDRVFLLHAAPEVGVQLLPVSRYLSRYTGRAWYVPLVNASATFEARRKLLDWGLNQLGRDYDYKGVLHYVLPFIHQQGGDDYCSELVAEGWKMLELVEGTSYAPGELMALPCAGTPVEIR